MGKLCLDGCTLEYEYQACMILSTLYQGVEILETPRQLWLPRSYLPIQSCFKNFAGAKRELIRIETIVNFNLDLFQNHSIFNG